MNGTLWDIPILSIASHGTIGWDGQLEWGYCEWDTLGHSHSVHCFPWYNGMDGQLGWGYCEWDALGYSHSVHCFPWYIGTGLTVGIGVL